MSRWVGFEKKNYWGKKCLQSNETVKQRDRERLEKRERKRRTHRERQKKSQRIVKDETPVT